MTTTLRAVRDRSGHSAILAVAFAAALLWTAPASAGPGNYKAQRFDVAARAVNGDLEVTETIAFEFQSGTFTKVWREIPVSRTDGVKILDAAMDGIAMTPGDGPGHYIVSGRNGVRVEWRFAEIGPSVHRFELRYVARGVAYRDGDHDVVRWRALPSEHRYRIDAARFQFEPLMSRVVTPETRRVGSVTVRTTDGGVAIEASDIQSNGWVIAELRYPAGALTRAEPQWRQRNTYAREMTPKWAIGGGVILVAGLCLLIMMRQGFTPTAGAPGEITTAEPPEALPAALAAVLAAKGGIAGYQPIATILDLADRGALRVREIPNRFGMRKYEIAQIPGRHDLEPHETEALLIAFAEGGDDVPLSKARGRLARASRRFRAAVNADLDARGLIDPDRKAARDRLTRIGLTMILAAALAAAGVAPLVPRHLGWPFLLPLGLLVAGLVGIVMAATISPLSEQGLAESARWRGFKRHLKTLASRRDEGAANVPSRWIVYAISVGLAHQWSRYLKRHPDVAPPWFVAAGADPGHAFAAFVGSDAATSAGSGAGGGGAAAGGGGSGAG